MDALAAVVAETEAAGDEEVWVVEVAAEGLVAGVVLHRDPMDRLRVNTVLDEEQNRVRCYHYYHCRDAITLISSRNNCNGA